MRTLRFRCVATLAFTVVTAPETFADVLMLRDGRRIAGTVVAIHPDIVEFETGAGQLRRLFQFPRFEVRSIEFDEWRTESRSPDYPFAVRQRTLLVDARRRWTETGIVVRAGQTVTFSATGLVQSSPGRSIGPAGRPSRFNDPARPIAGENVAALIGSIGTEGDPFPIGDPARPLRMPDDGPLFLGVNDGYLEDNGGTFRVTVSY